MDADAFVHLPQLRHQVTPPDSSRLRMTPDVMAMWDQRARDMGRPANWRLPDEAIEASRQACFRSRSQGEDLWVFAYGSLMWDPGFYFSEVRQATLAGFQRRFTQKMTIGRGSVEQPALMLTLEQEASGACEGLVFRIPGPQADFESGVVWRREMLRDDYRPAFLPVRTPQGEVAALVFCANEAHPDRVLGLSLDQTAAVIASGAGVLGTNQEYLELMRRQLDAFGILDTYVQDLAARVQACSRRTES